MWPFLVLIAVGIKTTSRGPVIFRQRRCGFMQKEFVILKFRTMYQGSGRSGVDLTSPDDPRITPVGRFLRKSRLDELPQFWNVLRGDMSVIGPRPYEILSAQLLLGEEPKAALRFTVPPGITGLAQVRGRNGKTLDRMARDTALDLEYINRRSLRVDIGILLQTICIMCKGKGI